MKKLLYILLLALAVPVIGQVQITVEGIDSTGVGYVVPTGNVADVLFRWNRIYKNTPAGSAMVLRCGTDSEGPDDNNLDGAIIKGNYMLSNLDNNRDHGLESGYNEDYVIKYNYFAHCDYGIIFEGTTNQHYNDVDGTGASYNILKGDMDYYPMICFGMDSVPMYNNTIYSTRSDFGGNDIWEYGVIRIVTSNQLDEPVVYDTTYGTKIINNIVYSENNNVMIRIDSALAFSGTFTSDYNIFWTDNGSVKFNIDYHGTDSSYTFEQWQAFGFDTHSQELDPQFEDTINFVPGVDVSFGMELTSGYEYGLAEDAEWIVGSPPDTIQQPASGGWWIGAVIPSSGSSGVSGSPVHSGQKKMFHNGKEVFITNNN
jgi:hypothetical protein